MSWLALLGWALQLVYKLDYIALKESRRPSDAYSMRIPHCNLTLFFFEGGMGFLVSNKLQQHLRRVSAIKWQ